MSDEAKCLKWEKHYHDQTAVEFDKYCFLRDNNSKSTCNKCEDRIECALQELEKNT